MWGPVNYESMESVVEKLQILIEQLRSEDEERRRSAVVGLAGYPLAETREYLFIALGDGSWRVRKEAVDALLATPVSVATMEELVGLLRSQDNAGLRNSAVEALEKLRSRAVPVLCRHVADPDHDVRKFVIDILGSIGDPAAVPLLIKALDDTDPNVCAAAAENLGKIGDAQAVPPLLEALAKNDIWLRYTILDALSRIGKPVPMAVIAPMAGENLLKKAVFDCLGVIGDWSAVPLLLDGIKERVKNAREAAAVALVKVRERLPAEAPQLVDARLRELSGSPYVEGLLNSLDTADRNLKEALVKVLGIVGDERATERLLRGCRDERLRRFCLQAFAAMGETVATSLVRAFPGADDEERCYIAYICGELHYPGCTTLLCDAMRDANPMLRKVAVTAAGKTGQAGLITEIAALLDDAEPEVRDGALEALSRLSGEDAAAIGAVAGRLGSASHPGKRRDAAVLFAALAEADRLSLLIKDEDALVRKTAVNALAELRSASSVGHLVMALVDEDTDVRIAAAGALGGIGGEEVLEPLLLALKDEDPWVRCSALNSLGRLRHPDARQAIVALLETADGLVAISALEALAGIGGEEVLAQVKKALDNPDEEVVKAAITILAGQGGAWLDEYRERLLAHPHWDVRRSFINAMVANWGAEALPYLRSALDTESDPLVKEQILDVMDRFQ
jgi:HEAT repeat protein